MITTQIEIARPPAEVREAFLDFPTIPTYTTAFIKSITPPPGKTGLTVAPGDKLTCVLEGMTISPVVLENAPQTFTWRGTFLGLFNGEHSFQFLPSETTPGATTFVHGEVFSGVLGFLMREGWSFEAKTRKGFEGFNADLRGWCEGKGKGKVDSE